MIDKTAVVPKNATDYRSKVDLRVLETRPDHYRTVGEVKRTRRKTLRKCARRNSLSKYAQRNRCCMPVSRINKYFEYIANHPKSWDES